MNLRQRQLRFVSHYGKAMQVAVEIVEHAEKHLTPQQYWRMEKEALLALQHFEKGGLALANIFDRYSGTRPPSSPPPSRKAKGGSVVPFRRRASRPPRKS